MLDARSLGFPPQQKGGSVCSVVWTGRVRKLAGSQGQAPGFCLVWTVRCPGLVHLLTWHLAKAQKHTHTHPSCSCMAAVSPGLLEIDTAVGLRSRLSAIPPLACVLSGAVLCQLPLWQEKWQFALS